MRISISCLHPCLVVALLLVSAPLNASQVTSVTLCREVVEPDLVPVDITEVFTSDAPELHAIVALKGVQDHTLVQGVLVSVNAVPTPNYRVSAVELEMSEGHESVHFAMSRPEDGWPPGDYKLEVSIDGRLAAVKTFKIVTARQPCGAAETPSGGTRGTAAPTGSPAQSEGAYGTPKGVGDSKGSFRGRSGGTYRHPAGFTFWCPAGWSAKITEEVLQLVPPNPGTSPEGPTEIYIVAGESVAGEGIFSPQDPRVVEYIDQQVRSVSPYLILKGAAVPVSMGHGHGVELNWEGTSPRGDLVRARAFVTIVMEHGISLIGIGFKDLLQARDADLRQMFSSFGFGAGENDPAVVGSWRLAFTSAVDNQSPFESAWSRAQAVSETKTILDIRSDGTCSWSSKNTIIVGAGDVWLEDSSGSTSQGQWYAGSGIIYIIWDDNTVRDCTYQIDQTGGGRRLRMVCGGKGEIWEPAR